MPLSITKLETKMRCIQAFHVLVHKAEDVWRDSIHPTARPQDIQYYKESLFASFFGKYDYFPFYLFPFSVSVPSRAEHRNSEHEYLASTIWYPLLPSLTIILTRDEERNTHTKGAYPNAGAMAKRMMTGFAGT